MDPVLVVFTATGQVVTVNVRSAVVVVQPVEDTVYLIVTGVLTLTFAEV